MAGPPRPHQPDPGPWQARQPCAPSLHTQRVGAQVRRAGRQVRQTQTQRQRQAHQFAMQVERGRYRAGADDLVEAATAFGQVVAGIVDFQNDARAATLTRPRHQLQELEGVAIALLVVNQQGLARKGLPIPARLLHMAAAHRGVRHAIAEAVFAPARVIVPLQQQQLGQIKARARIRGRGAHDAFKNGAGFVGVAQRPNGLRQLAQQHDVVRIVRQRVPQQ